MEGIIFFCNSERLIPIDNNHLWMSNHLEVLSAVNLDQNITGCST